MNVFKIFGVLLLVLPCHAEALPFLDFKSMENRAVESVAADCAHFIGTWQGSCVRDGGEPVSNKLKVSVISPHCQGIRIDLSAFDEGTYYFGGMQKRSALGEFNMTETTVLADRLLKEPHKIRREVFGTHRDTADGVPQYEHFRKWNMMEFDLTGQVTVLETEHREIIRGLKETTHDSEMKCTYSKIEK